MTDAALPRNLAKDGRRVLVTPEGVALNLRLASAGQRLSAFLLDLLIVVGSIVVVTIVLALLAYFNIADKGAVNLVGVLWLIGFFFLRNFYFLLMELGPRAATFGKRITGLRVVARNGGQLTADAVIARNLMRELELFLPLSFLVVEAAQSGVETAAWILGLVWTGIFLFFPLFNRDRLRVGDMLAGTWVIHAPKHRLGQDLMAIETGSARFTDAQLGAYGIFELQTLEQVLRIGNPEGMATVAYTIREKIGAHDGSGDLEFLQDYYAALRTRLEREVLLGRRRGSKHDI